MLPDVTIGMWSKRGGSLPYDHEVEWIERDGTIPLTVSKDLSVDQYWTRQNEIKTDLVTNIEVECMGYGNGYTGSTGSSAPIFVPAGRSGAQLLCLCVFCMMSSTSPSYINMAGFAEETLPDRHLEGFSRYRIEKYRGGVKYYIDDILQAEKSVTATSVFGDIRYGVLDRSSSRYPQTDVNIRVRRIKMDDIIDMIPVVKDNRVGLYNRVDGALILSSQPCFKAGPVLS